MEARKWAPVLVCMVCFYLFCCGCGNGGGNGGGSPKPPKITSVTVSPKEVTLQPEQTQQFSVKVEGTGEYSTAVTWSVVAGSVDQNGFYTAPSVVPDNQPIIIMVTSVSYPSKHDEAKITVIPLQTVNLEWAQVFDFGDTLRDNGFAAATDSQSNVYVGGMKWLRDWANPDIPPPTGVILSLNMFGGRLWQDELQSGSTVRDFCPGPLDTVYFTGTDTVQKAGLAGQFDSSGRIIMNKSFQIGSAETAGLLVRDSGVSLYVAADTTAGSYVAVADRSVDITGYFQVGAPQNVNADTASVTGLALAPDHLWVSGNRLVGGKIVGFYAEKYDLSGVFLNVRLAEDGLFGTSIIEDAAGSVYLAGTAESGGISASRLFHLRKLDQSLKVVWQRDWDGGTPNANSDTFVRGLTIHPSGNYVVVFGQLTEIQGADSLCVTYPSCSDAGLWLVDPSGATISDFKGNEIGKIRQDFPSPFESANAAAFDNDQRLVVVGSIVVNPTGTEQKDNRDILVLKFRLP